MATKAPRRARLLDAADRLALATSAACLVHCLSVPLTLAFLPMLAIIMPESLHLWLVVIAIPISGYALLAGRSEIAPRRPIILGATGLAMLAIGTTVEGLIETLATLTGGLLLAAAHIENWRHRHSA